jgi:hypothetical protein
VYHGSIKGAANPSCRSSASPETEEGAAGTDSPGMGGGAIGAPLVRPPLPRWMPLVPTGEPLTPRLNWVEGEDPPELRRKKPWTPQATNNKKNFLQHWREERSRRGGCVFPRFLFFFSLFPLKDSINIEAVINAQGVGG